jgi:NAD(P)-dependent dehydrogenase (short-subunit alcohol dehydrogenase family)
MATARAAVVVGVGPGLGAAVARRFARGGFAVALLARSERSIAPVAAAIDAAGGVALGLPCDATAPAAVAAAFAQVRERLGAPEVLVYNAGAFRMGGVVDVTPEQFDQAWRANCFGAFLCAQQALPAMAAAGRGTVLLTGATASRRGAAGFACLAVGKFGLRALAQSMAREFGTQGVHVAHVVVDGVIDTPQVRSMLPDRPGAEMLAPDALAELYWQLHVQPPSAWTLELDVRPSVERF